MTERHTLLAFMMLILAICFIASIAAFLAWHQRYAEALGFGGLTTGLVGILGTFRPRMAVPDSPQDVTVVNPATDPVQIEDAVKT